MDELSKQHLMAMVGAKQWEDVPEDLRIDCEVVDALVKKVKPYGGLASTQIIAMLVQRSRDGGS